MVWALAGRDKRLTRDAYLTPDGYQNLWGCGGDFLPSGKSCPQRIGLKDHSGRASRL